MPAEIELITFADRNVTPVDDAVMWNVGIAESGVIYGCGVTLQSANMLHVESGHGVICGRKFTMYESNIPVTLSDAGSLKGRIYAHMDLSNTASPLTIEVETAAVLSPEVHDENVNIVNGVWDVNLATFDVNEVTISNVVNVFPTVNGHCDMLAEVEKDSASAHAYSAGQYIVWRNKFWKVIAAISVGDEIVPGTNISSTGVTVGDELNSLNSSLTNISGEDSDNIIESTSSGVTIYTQKCRNKVVCITGATPVLTTSVQNFFVVKQAYRSPAQVTPVTMNVAGTADLPKTIYGIMDATGTVKGYASANTSYGVYFNLTYVLP